MKEILYEGEPRFSLKEMRAIPPYRGPKRLLMDMLDEIERKRHYGYHRSWEILIELMGDYLGLTTTKDTELRGHILETGLMERYFDEAIKEPWDHLGEIFTDLRLWGPGQNLTPKEIVDFMIEMTLATEKQDKDKPVTVLDPALGTGRFLIEASRMNPDIPLILFGIEINLWLYRAALVNMKLFSTHPYFIICADTLILDIEKSRPFGPAWAVANRWDPPNMEPYSYHPPPPSPINPKSFSLSYFAKKH